MGRALIILHTPSDRERAAAWVWGAPVETRVEFKAPKRSLEQNSLLWAALTDVAQQVQHMGQRYTPDEWKILFMHACGREVRFLPGLDGKTFVPWGQSSSDLSKQEMSELIDFIFAWGAEHGVTFRDQPKPQSSATAPSLEPADDGSGETAGPSPADAAATDSADETADPGTGDAAAPCSASMSPAPDQLDERAWLKYFARGMVAAIGPDEQVVVNQSKALYRDGLSDGARAKARSITNYTRAICRNEIDRDDALETIAGVAGCDVADLEVPT